MKPLAVPADAPPIFVAIAQDDFHLAQVRGFPLIESYLAADWPVEFHLFPNGGHGFGSGVSGTPTEGWLDLLLHWLKVQVFIEGIK